jgi:hypothetical protein
MIRRHRAPHRSAVVLAALVAAILAGTAGATVFANAASIAFPPGGIGSATPYPSNVTASGLTGGLASITATITNLSHSFVSDVDILLVGPTNHTVVLMSDVGGINGTGVNPITLTFSDGAAGGLSCSAAPVSGTYKPTDCAESTSQCNPVPPDAWPGPAPSGPYGTAMGSMLGAPVNGTYSLYAVDDCAGDTGSIAGGWSINITGGGPTAVKLTSFGALPSKKQVVVHWRTASEASLLGFNVYRVDGSRTARLNRALIPAKAAATIADGSYRLVDRSIRAGRQYTYRLQAVSLSGSRTTIGSASVRIAD